MALMRHATLPPRPSNTGNEASISRRLSAGRAGRLRAQLPSAMAPGRPRHRRLRTAREIRLMQLKVLPPGSPPAIWTVFARQAAWRECVIAALVALNALTIVAAVRVARKDPDVVVVAPDGKSSYVPRSVANDALMRFLAEQKQQPSDVTVVHFTREFLQLALAINSSTIDGAWHDALALMGSQLRERFSAAAAGQKLRESYKLARVRTMLSVDSIELVDHTSSLLHVRAVVTRKQGSLLAENAPSEEDRLAVELVERVVPRTSVRPDGLEVVEMRITPIAAASAAAPPSGTQP